MRRFEYELWVDRGGTFTDCVLLHRPSGRARTLKLLSSDDAPVVALDRLLSIAPGAPRPAVDLRIGTTLGTNALLERRGARTLLVTDRGLGDLVHIRDQARPELFARTVTVAPGLPERVLEVDVRIDAHGQVHGSLDEPGLLDELREAHADGLEAVAIALRFSPLAPEVEASLGELARRAGFTDVVLSHRIVPEPGHLARLETTVVDAYVTPVLRRYFGQLAQSLPGSRIQAMQSDGTLAPHTRFRGRDSALSGPAGGLVAAARVLRELSLGPALTFDMGGTSTDVFRLEGVPRPRGEGRVAGLRLRAPMLSVHTVAAGGGSICRLSHGRLVVGPESAGAVPGPLCYGHDAAEALTLTDVALVLGRIVPEHFPIPLDGERAFSALRAMADTLPLGDPLREPLTLAEAFFEVSVDTMARALADVSIAEGHDPREHVLVVYGGAGGQYACAIARKLGLRALVFHPLGGVFSAFGIGMAPLGLHRETELGGRELAEEVLEHAGAKQRDLEADIRAMLVDDGADRATLRLEAYLVLRYRGTETPIEVPLSSAASVAEVRTAFESRHRLLFGVLRPSARIEAIALRVYGRSDRDVPTLRFDPAAGGDESMVRLRIAGEDHQALAMRREALAEGERLRGPAVLLCAGGTLVLEPGFGAERRPDGTVVFELEDAPPEGRVREPAPAGGEDAVRDPIRLEVMGNLVASIADRMGHVLRQTASSPNIRDRLDYSCAVFDADGGLVANAPHIPVHLGAMGDSVRAVLRAHPDLRDGDVYVTNDPTDGGSHLPDITVVAPVFDDGGVLRAFVGNRGHHADVGGRVPGSMPAFSTTLAEEGCLLGNLRLVRDGVFDEAVVRAALSAGLHPARHPDENLRDLRAQVASTSAGVRLLREAFARHGAEVVTAYVGHLQDSAEERVRAALRELPFRGRRVVEDALDDGTVLRVALDLGDDGTLSLDFTGTSPPHRGNANAPTAVLRSAVLYVLRMLVGRPMPLNEGCLRAVRLEVPSPSLLAPPRTAAVCSGNVETSQRVVDVLMSALGLAAASQGTMNNVTLGNARYAYYETLGGGAGATEAGPGASAVHTHMTNSRLTDVEVIESTFPIRIVETSIRRGSGGAGLHRGGDGMVREYELLEDAEVSVVSERRSRGPSGLAGGGEGRAGENRIDGEIVPGRFERALTRGQRLRIETPGGGGYGR